MAAACSSTSSSSDEDRDKFAEIVRSVHLETGNFNTCKGCHDQREFGGSSSKPSLRHWRRDEEQTSFTDNSYITPEFQKHVAKKLTTFLDSCVQMTDVSENNPGYPQESSEGIKLTSSAKHTLKAAIDDNKKPSGKKRPSEMCLSSSSEDEVESHRLAEAAVSGYSIIANSTHEDVMGGENDNPPHTSDKDHSKHKRNRKKMKQKKDKKKCKSEKKKKHHKET